MLPTERTLLMFIFVLSLLICAMISGIEGLDTIITGVLLFSTFVFGGFLMAHLSDIDF